jgi:hypothetical protein
MFIVTLGSAYKDNEKGERNQKTAGAIKETREPKNQKRHTQIKRHIQRRKENRGRDNNISFLIIYYHLPDCN